MSMPPPFLSPMTAVAGDLPSGDGWAYELKWDGMRVLASTTNDQTELRARSGIDITSSFPELATLASSIGTAAGEATVFDGEVVSFVDGKPSFQQLQRRIHNSAPSAQLISDVPIVYLIFDLLLLDGKPVHELDYLTRRKFLRRVVDDQPSWKVPAHDEGSHHGLLALAKRLDLEGLMAKRLNSSYKPGKRSRSWVKVKNTKRQEFVIAGWHEGDGDLQTKIGSLILGVWHDGQLVFAGTVGSGLTEALRKQLSASFTSLNDCPFGTVPELSKPPRWASSPLTAEVKFLHWTDDHKLRFPSLLGVRNDKDPSSIKRE